ncbi:hypothetical protein MOC32_05260 [Bacillus spizizenii]|nr:hypothetical protein [Bacillus spizizenii]MCY9291207.1 hypothetical protein [Bacillus spizizenii]
MGKNSKAIGDNHVKSVYQALLQSLNSKSISSFSKITIETISFIRNLYPEIDSVTSKFDNLCPDKSKDLTLYLKSGKTISLNLFLIKKGRRIQPKNPGAKSFLEKYFLSTGMQKIFNKEFERYYLYYLKEVVEHKEGTHYITDKRELKRLVSNHFPKFTEEINLYRDKFLFNLRETCFTLLQEFYNEKNIGFTHAFNVFFMVNDTNIITSYGKDENDVKVEKFAPAPPSLRDIELYKTGKSTVGIKFGEVGLTLRFKFESAPGKSIKLATSYHEFPKEQERVNVNLKTMRKMVKLLSKHEYVKTSNNSNAIGKCHEAWTYYYFLKAFPDVIQVDPKQCIELIDTYFSSVNPITLKKLYSSTSTIVDAITNKLRQKYNDYIIESIELIPDAYIKDRLDTGDLQLVLKVNNNIIVENISLKALAKRNSKITTKNPGMGSILGPTYFNMGSMESVINEVKTKFTVGELNHRKSLEILSYELGIKLNSATQEQLRRGIHNLLGKAMIAITIYGKGISFCKEPSEIDGEVKVHVNVPSAIQNTLTWNNELESISLRAKFSGGQKRGWSSIKLTSECQLESR